MTSTSLGKKRFIVAGVLAIVAGLVCTWFASSSLPSIWGTAMMRTIITNRFLIGLVIALAGVYAYHPVFNFRLPRYIRGLCLGCIVSLPLATGAMTDPMTARSIFRATLVAGGFYGIVIDYCATHFAGEGKVLVK